MYTKSGKQFHVMSVITSSGGSTVYYTVGEQLRRQLFIKMPEKEAKSVIRAMVKAGKII